VVALYCALVSWSRLPRTETAALTIPLAVAVVMRLVFDYRAYA
jgi:hypothetical protein